MSCDDTDTQPETEPAERSGPIGGTPESAAWFRAKLLELGETQASLARFMRRKGDDRKAATIERNLRRMANGQARVSGEMRVVLGMLTAGKRRAREREAAEQVEG